MKDDDIIQKGIEIGEGCNYSFIVDYTRDANESRFFLINVKEEKIEQQLYTTHGSGSGSPRKALHFSNEPNSLMSCLGLIKTGGTYDGKHGYSCKLIGLEDSNSNIYDRCIVIHPASYATEEFIEHNGFPGRSWGCLGLDPDLCEDVIEKLKNGSRGYLNNS